MRPTKFILSLIVPGSIAVLTTACGDKSPSPPAQTALPVAATALCQPTPGALPPPAKLADWALGAQLFDDLGNSHRKITTSSEEAQRYFDQGMRLLFGFNHDESTRAFVKASQIDPECASCYWGAALTLGPNYNVPMLPDRAQAAWDALTKAKELAPKGTPVEQALIAALAQRYAGPEPLDPVAMQPRQEAFAKAMREVAKQFPDDLDVQTLFAESLMTANPWKLWSLDGKPAPTTPEVVATLEKVLAKDPLHVGANHYYIHAVEASPNPEKALAAAERLAPLMKGAGHIVHMPAHIFQRVGRYADAAASNADGAAVDLAYMKRAQPPGYYPMYLAHNYDFLSSSAAMEGRSKDAIAAARQTAEAMPQAIVDAMPGMDFALSKVYSAQLRFGLWDEVLATAAPPDRYPVLTGMYRYAHAYAQAAKGRADEADKAKVELDAYIARLPAELAAGLNSAKDVLAVASDVLGARIAQARGQGAEQIKFLQQAVKKEDQLAYDEPKDWYFPSRHLLGAALLNAGKGKEAEAVYRADLRQHPNNGWALFGLAASLKAQKKDADAARAEEQFKAAWSRADVTLTASAL